MYEFDIAEKQQ